LKNKWIKKLYEAKSKTRKSIPRFTESRAAHCSPGLGRGTGLVLIN
jgi:hypothetical protein